MIGFFIYYIIFNYIVCVDNTNGELFAVETLTQSIECDYRFPNVSVSLKRYNYTLKTDYQNLTYYIPYVSYSDVGAYVCEYETPNSEKYFINLYVYENPFLTNNNYETIRVDSTDSNVILTCGNKLTFPALYEWNIDNRQEVLGTNRSISIETKLIIEDFLIFKCSVYFNSTYVASKLFGIFFYREPSKPIIKLLTFSKYMLDIAWDPPIYDGGLPIISANLKCEAHSKSHTWFLSPTINKFKIDWTPFNIIFQCSISYSNTRFTGESDTFNINTETLRGEFSIERVEVNNENIAILDWFQPKSAKISERCYINIHNIKTNLKYQLHIQSSPINQQSTPRLEPNNLYKITVHYFIDDRNQIISNPVYVTSNREEYHSILYPQIINIGSTFAVFNWTSKAYKEEKMYQIYLFICPYKIDIDTEDTCTERAINMTIAPNSTHRILNLSELKPQTVYRIRMSQKLSSSNKLSDWSLPIVFTTKNFEPKKPTKPTKLDLKKLKNELFISWMHPYNFSSLISGFMISLLFQDNKLNLFVPSEKQNLSISLGNKKLNSVSISGYMRQTRGEEATILLRSNINYKRDGIIFIIIILLVFIIGISTFYLNCSHSNKVKKNIYVSALSLIERSNSDERKECFCTNKNCIFFSLKNNKSTQNPSEILNVSIKIIPGYSKLLNFKMDFKNLNQLINFYKLEHQIILNDNEKKIVLNIKYGHLYQIINNESKYKNSQILPNLLGTFNKNMVFHSTSSTKFQSKRYSQSCDDLNGSKMVEYHDIPALISYMISRIDKNNQEFKLFLKKDFIHGLKALNDKIDLFISYLEKFEHGFISDLKPINSESKYVLSFEEQNYVQEMINDEIDGKKVKDKIDNMFDCIKNISEEINKVYETKDTTFEKAMEITDKSLTELKEIIYNFNDLGRARLQQLNNYVSKCNNLHQETNKLLNIKTEVRTLRENVDNIAKIVNNML